LSEADSLRAILLRYEGVHFLLNREQCGSSRFVAESPKRSSGNPYLREVLRSGEVRTLLFDLDLFLVDTFRLRPGGAAQLALMVGLGSLGEGSRTMLGKTVFPRVGSLPLDRGSIAFRVPSNAVTRSLGLGELEPNGMAIRKPLLRRGIVALHLMEGSMGFLLDLDRLVASGSLFAVPAREGELG